MFPVKSSWWLCLTFAKHFLRIGFSDAFKKGVTCDFAACITDYKVRPKSFGSEGLCPQCFGNCNPDFCLVCSVESFLLPMYSKRPGRLILKMRGGDMLTVTGVSFCRWGLMMLLFMDLVNSCACLYTGSCCSFCLGWLALNITRSSSSSF